MSLLTAPAVPDTAADERAARLTEAAAAWGERIAQNPASAQLTYRVSGAGEGSVATTIRAGKHAFVVDEPAALAGDDVAASPVEYALGALIACQVVTYRFWAARLGVRLDDVTISAVGDLDVRGFFGLDDDVRPGFGDVRLEVRLTGPETAERYAELHAAVDAHCPVLDLFSNPTPVRTTLATAPAA